MMNMKTVPEDRREDHASGNDQDEGDGSRSDDQSVFTDDETGSPNVEPKFALAATETLLINRSKIVLLLVIASVAIAASVATFLLVKKQENSEYHSKFHDISSEIAEFSQLKADLVMNNLESFGATLTSYAMDANYTWPFVVFPDFQVRGILSNQDTGAHTLSINPLVFQKDIDAWSNFSVSHQGWMKEAHAYDRIVHPELYELEYHETSYHHNEDFRWNKTGITPYIWTYDQDDRYARPRVSEALLYTPIWQRAPPCDYAPQVNLDLHSDPTFHDHIEGMLAVDHPVITKVVDATYLETNYEYRFDPTEMAEPHSYLLEPVYDNLTQNRTAVAFLSAFLRWGTFFTDVLPSTENGIFVVLESSCNQTFTYEIFGHKAVYIGEGDLHDRGLDRDGLEDTFEFSAESQSAMGLELDGQYEDFCHYYAHVFPSDEWRDPFFTERPYTYALTVLCCFLLTALGFFLYDVLVQRRQRKVMHSAEQTNAIVTSLFPENVRDRLLRDREEELLKQQDTSFLNTVGKTAFLNNNDETTSAAIFGSQPIADLFTETTIMFGDLVGFTAWSSTREPTAVFTLLETVYHSFDEIARRRRVFKVETVGDCYVACCGLPVPRKDHCVIMAKFASECLIRMKLLVRKLETSLGPDTGDLNMRIGLHSGPVTAGVLRGDKGRFQLFGDTMNVASRMESTGTPGKIHLSRETAEILINAGKEKWVTQREDQVIAKGKGALTTYWLQIHSESHATESNMSAASTGSGDSMPANKATLVLNKSLLLQRSSTSEVEVTESGTALAKLSSKAQRLVAWNVDALVKILKQIMARRESARTGMPLLLKRQTTNHSIRPNGTVLDEVRDVLELPQFDGKYIANQVDSKKVEVSDQVVAQLIDMVARIAGLYHDHPFHSFEHVSHVTMSVTKLLSRIVNPNEVSSKSPDDNMAEALHDHTFGITSDPLTQFACLIAALIHDADHPGVPNSTLVKEHHPLASKYNNKSVAEQNSVDLAWDIIMSKEYAELQACIYASPEELKRFRSIIVNVVMATDIMDKDLGAQRKARWEKAFAKDPTEESEDFDKCRSKNRKATIVLEHLMQASDVSHTMQHWMVFRKWNECLFREMYTAYLEGHSEKDPSDGWYQGELGFFDYYIIPLAKKLETCGVFGVSSHEYLSYAQANRREWEEKGQEMVQDYLHRYHMEHGVESC